MAGEGDHGLFGVIHHQPFEAFGLAVLFPQGRMGAVGVVQVAYPALHAFVPAAVFGGEQVPVEAFLVVPFAALGEFAAHEQQFFAGVAPHVAVVGAQVGELLPAVAGHFREQRAFAVHDFVMRQRQHEVFAVLVDHAEGEQVVVVFAVDGFFAHVAQGVVHPAHVPFELEAEAADFGGVADAGEGGAFFGDGDGAALFVLQDGVGALQEVDGFEVFAAAVLVWHPFAVFARVVAVDHRGDGINAQAVHAVVFNPVQRVAGEEVAHFVAAEVVDEGIPVLMVAFARVGVFVERRAVEADEAEFVGREVADDPVKQNVDARFVRFADEVAQRLRAAEAAGRRVEAERLVAPGAVEREFGERQQFDVGEAHFFDVVDEFVAELFVGEPVVVFRVAPPRAEVDFVDADRRVYAVHRDAFGVVRLFFRQFGDD